MDLANMPLFAAIGRKMNWLTARQRVLAENIANVDTPKYQSSDLRPLDFRKELAQVSSPPPLQQVATDPGHLGGSSDATGSAALQTANFPTQTVAPKAALERQVNGNTVSLEDELLKVSESAADYQLITNLYKKQIGMLNTAIGRGSGSS